MLQEQSEPYEPVFTVAHSYEEAQQVLRDRALKLLVSRSTLDAISGLADGYSSKVLAEEFLKRLGWPSIYAVLEPLGLALAFVDTPAAIERSKRLLQRFNKRDDPKCAFAIDRRKQAKKPRKQAGRSRAQLKNEPHSRNVRF